MRSWYELGDTGLFDFLISGGTRTEAGVGPAFYKAGVV
jgi:hypothetical protein